MISELINPLTILLHMFNSAILLVAVYFLLYKPVRKYMQKRSEGIAASLKEARTARSDADTAEQQSRDTLRSAAQEASGTIEGAAKLAQGRAEEIVAAANAQARDIVNRAHEDAEVIRTHARQAMEDEAAKLAVSIAAKVLAREVSAEDHRRLIEEFLHKVG